VDPNGRRAVSFLRNEVTTKIEGGQTSGASSIIEGRYPPGNFTPPHRHEKTDAAGSILEGALGVRLAEVALRSGAGTCLVRSTGEAVSHLGHEKGRLFVVQALTFGQ